MDSGVPDEVNVLDSDESNLTLLLHAVVVQVDDATHNVPDPVSKHISNF